MEDITKAEAERKVKEELERAERLRPDKEKLIAFADLISTTKAPDINSREAANILYEACAMMQKVSDFLIEKSKSI